LDSVVAVVDADLLSQLTTAGKKHIHQPLLLLYLSIKSYMQMLMHIFVVVFCLAQTLTAAVAALVMKLEQKLSCRRK
jgi:hypothetical protein